MPNQLIERTPVEIWIKYDDGAMISESIQSFLNKLRRRHGEQYEEHHILELMRSGFGGGSL